MLTERSLPARPNFSPDRRWEDSGVEAALAAKYVALRSLLGRGDGGVIGFSGGVDSTFLAAVARDVLGRDRAICGLAVSPSLSDHDHREALQLAGYLDLKLIAYTGTEFENPQYVANGPDRCFHCKQDLFTHLLRIAEENNLPEIFYGANLDDGLDFRPGHRAARLRGARAPLAEAGMTKSDVRELSRAFALPTADKPASPCLSSRIPYGQKVEQSKLAAIEAGESILRERGFREVRLRHFGASARVEVGKEELPRLLGTEEGLEIERLLKNLGFQEVVFDPQGFRSGNLNEQLTEVQRLSATGP